MLNNLIPWTICYHSWTALNREKTVSACSDPTDRRPNWPERAEQHQRASQSPQEKEQSPLKFSGQAHNDLNPAPASLSSICSPFFGFRSLKQANPEEEPNPRKAKIVETKAKAQISNKRLYYVEPSFSLSFFFSFSYPRVLGMREGEMGL
jgi:hypothetical protein